MGKDNHEVWHPYRKHKEALALSTLHVLLATSSGTVRLPMSARLGTASPWS